MAADRQEKPLTPAFSGQSGYTVVARRYRPQRFEDVVGQDHVVQALRNAIRMNRVTHAYLFVGTRGVGKTSIARIFAKCLNCIHGPTDTPCQKCDVCQAIAVGQDVDVIEIDGASNNGVDDVRELRQSAGLRPSRSRFKIYYIDEVHMLSTGAFNALLKTLEEPPEHVKFFFATTEPNKIPITVLSRCQRFDFAGITTDQITETLAGICEREKIDAEPDALRTVARRAGGSMRDAQSILEQLLSSSGQKLTVEEVHRLLGTASDERLLDLIDALAARQPAKAFEILETATREGVQPTDLLNGVLEFLRDIMVFASGAHDTLLTATPRQRPRLQAIVDRWSLETILAALQILSETRSRLRGSSHSRLLIEMGLLRVSLLEDMTEIKDVIARLAAMESGMPLPAPRPPATPASLPSSQASLKKKPDDLGRDAPPAERTPERRAPELRATVAPPEVRRQPEPPPPTTTPAQSSEALDIEEVRRVWPELSRLGLRYWKGLCQVTPALIQPPDLLVIRVNPRYNWVIDECGSREALDRIEGTLAQLLSRRVTIKFESSPDAEAPAATPSPASAVARRDELAGDPMIQKIVELFEARPIHLEAEEDATPSSLPG
ncbi:DNA polymerase III subunit gamma/tau [Singulisphaera sp. PoT]|uniref:DNA polymerase III subunit gamma/tau n=1 Tax=Singulisphaera sp. PoT TaxID=3411797 RepID=UPI003BF5B7EF